MRVYVDDKAEVRGQVAADFVPVVAGIVAAHDVPVLLHEEYAGARRVHGDAVNAMAHLGRGVGHDFGPQPAGDGPPGLAAVVGAKGAGGGDGDEDALRVDRV